MRLVAVAHLTIPPTPQTLGIQITRTSDDDWGVESPPKRKVFRWERNQNSLKFAAPIPSTERYVTLDSP